MFIAVFLNVGSLHLLEKNNIRSDFRNFPTFFIVNVELVYTFLMLLFLYKKNW